MIKSCVDAFGSEFRMQQSSSSQKGADSRAPVNAILVVGHEKLNVEMQRTYEKHITVVKVPKSGGVSP